MEDTTQQLDHHTNGIKEFFDDVTEEKNPVSSSIPVIPQLSLALGLLVFVFSVSYIGISNSLIQQKESPVPDTTVTEILPPHTEDAVDVVAPFESMQLEAQSAFVFDIQDQKVLYSKNADEALPLASITKLMTALVAYEILGEKSSVSISQDSIRVDGDSGLREGEKFSTQNLIDYTLITSSNDGAFALGATVGESISSRYDPEDLFVTAMNLKATEIGLAGTTYKNSTGLDVSEEEAGAYGTARDTAILMEYMLKQARDTVALSNTNLTSIKNAHGEQHVAENTNRIIDEVDGLIASKTGYTELSGGNLVVAVNLGLNRPIVAVVLGSTQNGRFDDMRKILEEVKKTVK